MVGSLKRKYACALISSLLLKKGIVCFRRGVRVSRRIWGQKTQEQIMNNWSIKIHYLQEGVGVEELTKKLIRPSDFRKYREREDWMTH
jgi:hypothetical protein